MSRQLFRTQYKHRLLSGGADEVIAVMPIPANGMLANVWGDVHVISTTNLNRDNAAVYTAAGFILPFRDDTHTVAVDTFWDQLIPKDTDMLETAGAIQFDDTPETGDPSTYEEIGEGNASKIFRMGNHAEQIYTRERILTIASRGLFEPVASSEDDLWMPTDHFRIRDKTNYQVEGFSYAMYAIGLPAMDDVTTANETTLDAGQQAILDNMELAISLAMPAIVGFTEAGAESPFGTLAIFIETMVEPTVEEETAAAFASIVLNIFSRFTFEIRLGAPGISGPIAA